MKVTSSSKWVGEPDYTALHLAAMAANVQGVQMLLADPRLNSINQKNNEGFTAVMCAMKTNLIYQLSVSEYRDVLCELITNPNVDLDARDRQGRSLEEQAR